MRYIMAGIRTRIVSAVDAPCRDAHGLYLANEGEKREPIGVFTVLGIDDRDHFAIYRLHVVERRITGGMGSFYRTTMIIEWS